MPNNQPGPFELWISDFFRISSFGIRIAPGPPVWKKTIRPDSSRAIRAEKGPTALLLFLLGRGGGGLSGLGLGHALLELIHAAGSIHKFLLARIKRMTRIANADDDHRLGGASLDHVAAGAADFRVHILRMNILFHKRMGKLSPFLLKTS